jgi:hypothetical protein
MQGPEKDSSFSSIEPVPVLFARRGNPMNAFEENKILKPIFFYHYPT